MGFLDDLQKEFERITGGRLPLPAITGSPASLAPSATAAGDGGADPFTSVATFLESGQLPTDLPPGINELLKQFLPQALPQTPDANKALNDALTTLLPAQMEMINQAIPVAFGQTGGAVSPLDDVNPPAISAIAQALQTLGGAPPSQVQAALLPRLSPAPETLADLIRGKMSIPFPGAPESPTTLQNMLYRILFGAPFGEEEPPGTDLERFLREQFKPPGVEPPKDPHEEFFKRLDERLKNVVPASAASAAPPTSEEIREMIRQILKDTQGTEIPASGVSEE